MLAEMFHKFSTNLDGLLKMKLPTPEVLTANAIYHKHICEEFETYAKNNFPLLRDFIFNFSADTLSVEQKD